MALGVLLVSLGLLAATALALPGAAERPVKAALSVSQRGTVASLYPGRSTKATVVVRNTSKRPVRIRSVTARPQATPGCPGAMLRVGKVRSRKVLRPRRSLVVRLPVQLVRAAPDSCQGRRFRLALRVDGTTTR
ncbi:hypothetical protein [Nocardioides sp. W7]|uniref:hypothetical protein n=1 Tax=Nocardioides sp. W7 TaxID=2931390 RepID=UPI001FD1B3A0|nr:hypothetical protein [Nocardioides sp. W7]